MPYVNVFVDVCDFDTEDLITELERNEYRVMAPGQIDEDVEALHRTLDEIHNLYYAFCAWKDGDKNERFESELKKFFTETIDMKVI
jgi:hypothetical protein